MGWGPVDWVGRVLPEAKFKNKWTLFFNLFLFERPILRYPVDWVGRVLPESKFENKWTYFLFFLFERPLLTRDWKSESVTN